MSERIHFTHERLDGLEPAKEGKRAWYRDDKAQGLALMVTDRGAKTFYSVRWHPEKGKTEQLKLGRYPDLTVAKARELAGKTGAAIAEGRDPVGDRRKARKEATFGELFDWWRKRQDGRGRSSSYLKEADRQFKSYLQPLASTRAGLVTRPDVRKLHANVTAKHGPYQANRTLALIRAVYNLATNEEQFEGANPAAGIEPNSEVERERRLMPGEATKFFEALAAEPDQDIRDFTLLALYTGARRSNVAAMAWADLDLDSSSPTWQIAHTKNGLPQTVPLEPEEVEILRQRRANQSEPKPGRKRAAATSVPWVFPSRSKTGHLVDPKRAFKELLDRAGISDFRIHDLRRSNGSFQADEGVPESIIGKSLNHLSPAATKVYARTTLNPIKIAKRMALDAMHRASSGADADEDMKPDAAQRGGLEIVTH